MRRGALALALLLVVAAGARAQDYVVTSGKLTDDEFYRLVACGAPPGGTCALPFVRWMPGRRVSVGLDRLPPGYPAPLAKAASEAIDFAIREINGAGAGISLARAAGGPGSGDILVRMVAISDGDMVGDIGIPALEGQPMGAAYVYVWWNLRNEITSAQILLADDLPIPEVYPVLLEEMTQALGFLTDIRNPAYDFDSVFAEDSNAVAHLGPQDRTALLRHYPVLH